MPDFLRNRLGLVLVGVAVLVLLSANRVATFLTDLWWFDALGYRGVFTTLFVTQLMLGLVFGVVLGLLVAGNLLIARRLRPFFVPSTPQQAAVERYRQMADPYLPWIIAGIAAVFALTSGAAVAGQWEPYMLWANAQEFGVADPQFSRDVGFYVFQLPWLKFVQTWLFTSLLLVTLLTAGAHYLLGGIRPESSGDKVLPKVRIHLSILLVAVLAVRGWGYWLDRYMLNFSPRGTVTGASYTDVNAELPALLLLLIVTAVAIGLVLFSIRRRGFLLPGAAIGLLVLGSILLQGAYPAAIQRLRVDPQELARETPYIERNLEMTREAYDLPTESPLRFRVGDQLDEQSMEENEVTLANIRLWDPGRTRAMYAQFQELRPFYEFRDVDVDRYTVDGEFLQVVLAARELGLGDLPASARTWQNDHTFFTQGTGVAASRVNVSTPDGRPVYLAEDIPPEGVDELVLDDQERGIYYDETGGGTAFKLVRTTAPELAFEDPDNDEQVLTNYAGDGGVRVGNYLRRLAYALRFSDPNMVLSGLIQDDSRIQHRRAVQERIDAVAPYLEYDSDPYPVVLDDSIVWVQDAYTTSTFYPYSERASLNVAGNGAIEVNYVRNSVKAVVDSYDGTVDLYVVDEEDPIVQAWRRAFDDGPFRSLDEAPEGLQEHFRYPEDLFTLQSALYTTYHIEGAGPFYNKGDAWEIPPDAALLQNNPNLSGSGTLLRPYYLLMRLPGEADEEFVLIQPYLPAGRPNLVGWLAGRSDPEHYGELFPVRFPTNQQVLGPQQAQSLIEQDSTIAEYITLRDQAGSDVVRGNLLALPVGDVMLYIEPLFLQSGQAEIPELDQVVLVLGETVVMESTLERALAVLAGTAEPRAPETGEDPGADGEQPAVDESVLQEVLDLFAQAQQALQDGDLGRYQELINQAADRLAGAAEEQGLDIPSLPSPTPTETPTATPTPPPAATATPSDGETPDGGG